MNFIFTRREMLAMTASFAIISTAVMAQDVPAGYPADYAELIKAAKAEGSVNIYTSTDAEQSQALQDAFTAKYGIAIAYNDLGTNGSYNQVISEAAAKQVTADLVWSSAMDLQMTLVKDGYTETYASPESGGIPSWANYKDTLYGTTVEPIGMIYNTKAITAERMPKTRADLIKFLGENQAEVQGKIATFDPEKSGTGFLHHTNDARQTADWWDLAAAMGKAGVKTYSSSGSMKETVVSGENVMAINIIGSYALEWVKESPNLGVAFGTDYTPAFSRLVTISKGAPHPNAAKLFVDFMLSKEGQNALAAGGLPSVRSDTDAGLNFESINTLVGGNLKPIAVDEGLLEYMDPAKRVSFFNEWKAAINP
jgi:iron(III) transport system substrate-binding protein